MKKLIVNPATCETSKINSSNAYAEITFSDKGALSIHGVIGPMSNGNCKGSCGQCVDEIRNGVPASGWTRGMLEKFCDIWEEWHLNDLHAECEHQRDLGWKELAKETITLYHYVLNEEASAKRKEAQEAALKALKDGESFTPSEEQIKYSNLDYFYDTYEKLENNEIYKPYKGYTHPAEEPETRGWVYFDKTPLGILGKPCPVCGWKYGHGWKTFEVPQEVIDWLFSLPETKTTPAWC